MSTARVDSINIYGRQLSPQEIEQGKHREMVGGLWDELGELQFSFMKSQGLRPQHGFADVGCGALRGGLRFIDFLESGNYCGLDINASLIQAGRQEVGRAGLTGKKPNLLVNDKFEISLFNRSFDYALAVSVFTHLPMNSIIRCLAEVKKALTAGGIFYATFFEAPFSAHFEPIRHFPGVTTQYDLDPFHYSFDEIKWMAQQAKMHVSLIGEWGHPKCQRMLTFT